MFQRQLGILSVALLVIIFAFGCSNTDSPVSSTPAGFNISAAVKAIPADAVVDSATMYIYAMSISPQTISVHNITSAWDESSVTWTSFGGAFDPDTIGTISFTIPGWYALDVTEAVKGWFDESLMNFGFYLQYGGEDTALTMIASSESGDNMPYLKVYYTVHEGDMSEDMDVAGDAHIFSADAGANFGDAGLLLLGGFPDVDSTYNALVMFSFDKIVRYVTLGGMVFMDENGNGMYDNGEPGVEGVTVNLYNCEDSLLASVTTDENGYYMFDSLMAGDYKVGFMAPNGYQISSPMGGMTECMTLLPGEEYLDVNAIINAYDGCTYGKGYWKNHAGFGPQADEVSALLPLWLGDEGGDKSMAITDAQIAVDILSQHTYGHPSNGITKLYAHLLTAKLNIANMANPEDIYMTIADADAFLAQYDWNDWDMLEKDQQKMVLQWMGHIEDYNEGEIGPGHCGDDDYDDNDDMDDDF
ncbi:MAG: DNRLRE domain-containing protein [Candidatus Zixiibacteriota bacterium]